jgi:hypothetical protein
MTSVKTRTRTGARAQAPQGGRKGEWEDVDDGEGERKA